MKLVKFLALVLWSSPLVFSQQIIPEPVAQQKALGEFVLTADTRIHIPKGNAEVRKIAEFLAMTLAIPTGVKLPVLETPKIGKHINFKLESTPFKVVGQEEGYSLDITPKHIDIKAQTPAGLFYGVQSLIQLFPKQVEGKKYQRMVWKIPSSSVIDYPRYAWRGIMLDVSRHFFPKEYIKSFIDQLARYKFNTFHWHLTDDQGWRIEIKSYPKLTSVGAWRVPRVGNWWERELPQEGEKPTYGGFYTQEDIKEIVAYAQSKYIQILPEIDVPGHSLAILTAYPELSCAGGNKFQVNAGWKFYRDVENSLCPSNEKVYEFLDKVFGEVTELFPHPYIHIGGDECYKGYWEKSAECQALMKREGLKNTVELQSYFVKRVEKILSSKGKKLIGWDEILEGGLAPEATVMSWRGDKGGIEAAKQNHAVVMTPNTFAYLDLYQGEPTAEPMTYDLLRLKRVYNFEPTPASVSSSLILGGQGNLWTESIPNSRHVEYMMYPRAWALSEVLWSKKEKRNWDYFITKMENQFLRMDEASISYSRSVYDPLVRTMKEGTNLKIEMLSEIKGLDLYYTFDGTNPDAFSPKYQSKLDIPKNASFLKIQSYRGGKPIGQRLSIPVKSLYDRAGRYNADFGF
ncbi:beta-N-acetylhexosaminidase [Flectobacillus rivi]|uniref:beta-N-acetylhexosaminidase n=1 Tax=Flectobacillus rivi TaxID=2984209 RepID=A0ABT6Z6Y1_9BACT|nr:family 20 glycosylhydrolase [Flectobacillus rivi]MDI9876652.1 family 20 glycosylhydrolase [Flectobacillus rivi]